MFCAWLDAIEDIVEAALQNIPNIVRHDSIDFLLGGAYAGVIHFLFNSAILLDLLRPLVLKSIGVCMVAESLALLSSYCCDWEIILLSE